MGRPLTNSSGAFTSVSVAPQLRRFTGLLIRG